MRQGMSGLSISHEPLNGNYSSCIIQRSNQNVPFCAEQTIKELTLTALQGFHSVLFCLWQISEQENQTWNLDCKGISSRKQPAKLSVYFYLFLLAFNDSDSVSVFHGRGAQPCALRCLPFTRYSQHIDEFHVRPWSQLASYSLRRVPFPSLITDRVVDLVLLVHVQEQMCWLCGA